MLHYSSASLGNTGWRNDISNVAVTTKEVTNNMGNNTDTAAPRWYIKKNKRRLVPSYEAHTTVGC